MKKQAMILIGRLAGAVHQAPILVQAQTQKDQFMVNVDSLLVIIEHENLLNLNIYSNFRL